MTGLERVLIIGFGPVAARLVDRLRAANRARREAGEPDRFLIMVVGAEPHPAYHRVMIGELATGAASRASLWLADAAELVGDGVDLRLGSTVTAVDREARTVVLGDGEVIGWHRLVFATGARAYVPALEGFSGRIDHRELSGVHVLRSLDDADRVRVAAAEGRRLVVVGGGVLGLELVLGLARAGADVTLIHTGEFPMARALDRDGGLLLLGALRAAGVFVVSDMICRALLTEPQDDQAPDGPKSRFTGIEFSDGRFVRGDELILTCGALARTELAEAAGLQCHNGILVDHDLACWGTDSAAEAGSIFAIGDCAEVRCTGEPYCDECTARPLKTSAPAGLIAPGWAQADALAERLIDAGPVRVDSGIDGLIQLKADELDLVAAGDTLAGPWSPGLEVAQWLDPAHGRYVKMITRQGRLTGLICVGMPSAGAELTWLYDQGAELPWDRSLLLRGDGPDAGDEPSTAPVCRCNGVHRETITTAIACGSRTVADVGRETRAGTGCGGCRTKIAALLEQG